jgi:hypothetical protein
MHRAVEQQVSASGAGAGHAVVAAVGLALQHAGAFQLLQHAVQGRLGQAGFLDQALQRSRRSRGR